MKKVALVLLTTGSLVGTVGVASAQYGYYYGHPGYYGHRYRERYYDYDDYRPYWRRDSHIDWYGHRCPPHFTVQDGVCKPYRGY